jgi:DNA repair exonuclease SbcCD nuclease subunit
MAADHPIRTLFFADTHLGFDLPMRPRIERRRRGHDFFANFNRVLAVCIDERVDVVVHGGDLFYRSRMPPAVVQQAFLPLKRLADRGIPVVIVPGNHERSRIPYPLLAEHPGIHIFHKPTTFTLEVRGRSVALAGFPYERDAVRTRFADLVSATGWQGVDADLYLLVVHHCFEGATVGPANYTFRSAADVVRHRDVPAGFAAVLTGHVHRHQVLTTDLEGKPLATPVLYPGSIERTSFAERDEPKGYMLLELNDDTANQVDWEFRQLPARPMISVDIEGDVGSAEQLERSIVATIAATPRDAVLRLRLLGAIPPAAGPVLQAANVRRLTPHDMNVEIVSPTP